MEMLRMFCRGWHFLAEMEPKAFLKPCRVPFGFHFWRFGGLGPGLLFVGPTLGPCANERLNAMSLRVGEHGTPAEFTEQRHVTKGWILQSRAMTSHTEQ